jgi:hypothetical protein
MVEEVRDHGQEAVLKILNAVLTADEKLEAWAVQQRWFALKHRRLALGATSGRFLAIERPLLGGFDLTDVRWQDLKDVHIHVGVLAARLQLTALESPDLASASGQTRTLVYEGLVKDQAQALYRICQAHDQGEADAVSRLRSAKSMLDSGLISDAEYEALKAKIISNV